MPAIPKTKSLRRHFIWEDEHRAHMKSAMVPFEFTGKIFSTREKAVRYAGRVRVGWTYFATVKVKEGIALYRARKRDVDAIAKKLGTHRMEMSGQEFW
jgi:hypothetical protein